MKREGRRPHKSTKSKRKRRSEQEAKIRPPTSTISPTPEGVQEGVQEGGPTFAVDVHEEAVTLPISAEPVTDTLDVEGAPDDATVEDEADGQLVT